MHCVRRPKAATLSIRLQTVRISFSCVQPVIHPYFPYFHLDVRADVLLFKPSPGMTLGKVGTGCTAAGRAQVASTRKEAGTSNDRVTG